MNLKPTALIFATALVMSLPLAGCGNKGPLVLPQSPPVDEAQVIAAPAAAEPSLPADPAAGEGVPVDDPATDKGSDVPPPPPSDAGNG